MVILKGDSTVTQTPQLYSLYLVSEGSEDAFDFWLDVVDHQNLCRSYFVGLKELGRTIEEGWPQYLEYASLHGNAYDKRVLDEIFMTNSSGATQSTAGTTEMLSVQDNHDLAPDAHCIFTSQPTVVDENEPYTALLSSMRMSKTFTARHTSRVPTINPRAITRMDLIASAKRIYFRYCCPTGNSSENHEIFLPPQLSIHSFPLISAQEPKTPSELDMMVQIPGMFDMQAEYCLGVIERDVYPRFMRDKAFGNLTPFSALARQLVGLIILWIGLAIAFALIFLDVRPKSKRLFVSCRTHHCTKICLLMVSIYLEALHSIHFCNLLSRVLRLPTRPHPRLHWPKRNNTVPHGTHPGAVRQETHHWADDMGHHGCDHPRNSAYYALLVYTGLAIYRKNQCLILCFKD
jgi:hypothetical protein